jgi:hypothetical protein
MGKSSFESKIQIDKVVNLLNDFKKAMYDVNYINKLITQNASNIIYNGNINNGYSYILTPIINKKYINNNLNNTNDNINRCDFYIASIPLDPNNVNNSYNYYSSRFPETENIIYNDIDSWNVINENVVTSNLFYQADGAKIDVLEMAKISTLSIANYINKCLSLNPNLSYMYQFDIREDPDGVVLVIRCLRRDVKNQNNWISISSSMKLMPYFDYSQNLQNLQILPMIAPIFNNLLMKLESSQWTDTSLVKNIWEYSNISNIDNIKCVYSEKYPNWNGKLISDCFIPNSNINVQNNMQQLFNDLYFYYPSLTVGELAFSTRNINGTNILSICKIDTYTDSSGIVKECIKEVKIELDKFFIKNNIVGDTIVDGNLNIQDGNGDSVLQMDNVTKNISIHGKVGINQDLHEIKGLLDIDNLSNENILTIIDKIADLNNTSYNVVDEVKDTILDNATFTISADYTNEIIIFKVPIKIKIEKNDISFLHKPSNIFKTSEFSNESFLKIQLIINEINRMSIEIDYYNVSEGEKLIMSFVELLNDTENYYVCSLKAIFKDSEIYFVMSFTLVQKIMIDNSYKQNFTNLINAFSSLNRLINYSILVIALDNIYNKLIEGDSVNSFTKYFQESEFSDRFGLKNGEYVLCDEHFSGDILDENNMGTHLFIEQHPESNLKYVKDIFIPNTDVTIDTIKFKALTYYKDKYGFYKNSQNFIVHYLYDNGEKISFNNKIIIKEKEYILCAGINLIDYIDLNILSTGDNKITGNLYIQDENKSNIFSVDTEYNKITNMYKTGFGTEDPKTIVDVNDSGLTDIINIIKDMANKEHALNLNIGFIKSLDTINALNIDNCINTQFIDSSGTVGYQQSKDDYFYCYVAAINDNQNDYENIYTWLYRNWDDKKHTNIDDKNNEILINAYINNILKEFKTQYIYDNLQIMCTSDWTFGKKNYIKRLFKNKTDNKAYLFGSGINIGNYNLKINNNGNISTFFDYIKYMNLYLQDFIIRFNSIDTTEIPNYKSVNDYFSIISNVVSPKQFNLKKIVADFTNFKNTKVYDIDFNTKDISGNNLNKTIYEIQDVNERNRYLLMLINIKSIYSKNNSNPQLFNKEDYGVINTEDNFVDFISLFYCSEVSDTSVTLISIELQINTVVQPSVDIRGDLRIKGDTYFHNNNTNTDFVSIDTDDSFVGIGTNIRYVNYNFNAITTTNNDLSKHNFIVSGHNYPVSVTERFAEIKPERDPNTNTIINYPDDALGYFTNRAALVCRRTSNYYSINEINEYSKKYTELALKGPYKGQPLHYKYGVDYAFEIQDSSNIATDLGTIHMVIDDIDPVNNTIVPGFGVEFADNFPDGSTSAREVMHINNDGVMNIDKIKLGMNPTTESNNILLSASNNDLLVNSEPLTDIINSKINDKIDSMFSLDPRSGNLIITYNGIKYVCNKM